MKMEIIYEEIEVESDSNQGRTYSQTNLRQRKEEGKVV